MHSQVHRLLKSIKGQQVTLPDLRSLFADWPGTTSAVLSPHHKSLVMAVDERLTSLYSKNPEALRKLKLADFGTFAALWWPTAALKHLKILAFLVIWLFTWDDELDEPSGSFADDFEAAQRYRAETARFVQYCLDVHDKRKHEGLNGPCPTPVNAIVESFRSIGEGFCRYYDLGQRRRLCEEILRLVYMAQREQEYSLSGQIPTIDQYWQFRLGTSAVYVAVASEEYCNQTRLPNSVMDCQEMRSIWDETNILISITNDLLSLKKEMKSNCIYSFVPIMCASGSTVQESVAEAVRALWLSKCRFNQAAASLREHNKENTAVCREVERFIETCRSNVVGNLIWSLKTPRYGLESSMGKNGVLTFDL